MSYFFVGGGGGGLFSGVSPPLPPLCQQRIGLKNTHLLHPIFLFGHMDYLQSSHYVLSSNFLHPIRHGARSEALELEVALPRFFRDMRQTCLPLPIANHFKLSQLS